MSDSTSIFSRRSSMNSMRRDSSIHEGAPYGFKVLATGEDPTVDIIAIHGLDGHRENSWAAKNGVLWLRDLLPTKIPNARIVTYGYDANTHGKEKLTKQFLHGHAKTFLSHLEHFRKETSTEDRPIIFIAHSLGGILLKSALIELHWGSPEHFPDRVAIASSVYEIFFIGTPHRGAESADFGRAALKIRSFFSPTTDVLLRLLKKDSEVIQHQLSQFATISGKFKIKHFYEMYQTEVAPGVKILIVPNSSAALPSAHDEAVGLYKDHVNLVRFESEDDCDYQLLSSHLLSSASGASQSVIDRATLRNARDPALANGGNNGIGFLGEDSLRIAREGPDVYPDFLSRP